MSGNSPRGLDPAVIVSGLETAGVDFFTGVPDSLLKHFVGYVTDHVPPDRHITAANEGGAVALAAGHHLATGRVGAVYLQNSGLGNALNPLASLVDPEVYAIPVFLVVGWRGEPGHKDEPQHRKQGRVTLSWLEAQEIPFDLLSPSAEEARHQVERLVSAMRSAGGPVALVVREGTFETYAAGGSARVARFPLEREDALRILLDRIQPTDIVVSTTGKASREIFEYREACGGGHAQDFLTVGSMGHCSQIALAIALDRADREVVCIDGDGAAIMHLGGVAIIGARKPRNLRHVVINNGAHESVGGQPTVALGMDFPAIARACGYRDAIVAESAEEIGESFDRLRSSEGPSLLEIRVNPGSRKDLGRPTTTPIENKSEFMQFVRSTNGE